MAFNIDVVYFIEHAARELDVACAVKALLAKQDIQMEICSIITGLDESLLLWKPRVVAIPYGTSIKDWNLEFVVSAWGDARYINLSFEQILGKTQKSFKAPKDRFARQHLFYSAWGEFFVDYLKEYDVPAKHICLVGNPALTLYTEPYRNYYGQARVELAKEFGLCLERRWVFIPENYGWAFFKDNNVRDRIRRGFDPNDAYRYRDFALASLQDAAIWWREASRLDGVELIVRPRPAIPTDKFLNAIQEYAGELPDHLHIIKHGSVREWILASDVVFSSYSTTLLDAALSDKPVYLMTPYPIPDFLHAEWYDLTEKVSNLEEFASAIQSEHSDTNWEALKSWVKWRMMSKGDAIVNLSTLIQRLVQGESFIDAPRQIAYDLRKPSVDRSWRKFRKRGWHIWQTVLSIMGHRDTELEWIGHEQDHISTDDVIQRVERWIKILGD